MTVNDSTYWQLDNNVAQVVARQRIAVGVKHAYIVARNWFAARPWLDIEQSVDRRVSGDWPTCLCLPPVINDWFLFHQGLRPQHRVGICSFTETIMDGIQAKLTYIVDIHTPPKTGFSWQIGLKTWLTFRS